MTKQETTQAKGLAILLMIFLHLFNHDDSFVSLINVGSVPLVRIMTRACSPVAFYLILGGIGLCIVWQKGRGTVEDNIKRILRLYSHYWIVLIMFVTIGYFINNTKYPGDLSKVLVNLIGYNTSYNGECWFLLPYALLSISAPLLFYLTEKINWKIVLSVTFLINVCTSFLISRYGEKYLFHNMLIYNPLLYFHLMFSFMLGAIIVRTKALDAIFNFSKRLLRNSALRWFVVVLLFMIPCIVSLKVFYCFYALAMIVAFTIAPKSQIVSKAFTFLGKHSMNMWMIHTWFAYYLFHDFIYGFRFPIVIFIILILASLAVSLLVNGVFSLSSFIYGRIAK